MSEPMIMNLKATRCPEAMLLVRKAIENAVEQEFSGSVCIHTIEQSMSRDLPFYLNSQATGVTLVSTGNIPLSATLRVDWLNSGEALEEDLNGIEKIQTFTLTF